MNATDKAIMDKIALATEYDVPVSCIVWIGNNHYVIVKDGREIRI